MINKKALWHRWCIGNDVCLE